MCFEHPLLSTAYIAANPYLDWQLLLDDLSYVDFKRKSLRRQLLSDLDKNRHEPEELHAWLRQYADIECRDYDLVIPPERSLKLPWISDDESTSIVLASVDISEHEWPFDSVLIERLLRDKHHPYLPKATSINQLEVCWWGFHRFNDVYLLHHTQINAQIKDRWTKSVQTRFYRFMLRCFRELAPSGEIYIPTLDLMRHYNNAKFPDGPYFPERAYEDALFRGIAERVQFDRLPKAFGQTIPSALLPASKLSYWRLT